MSDATAPVPETAEGGVPPRGPAGDAPGFRRAALIALALVYGAALAYYGGVTAEGTALFEISVVVAAFFSLLDARRAGALFAPNRRALFFALAFLLYCAATVPLSIWPEASRRGLLLAAHFPLLYLALLATLRTRRSLAIASFSLTAFVLLCALWGAAAHFGSAEAGFSLGWRHAGTFVNRNHFASLLGMMTPLTFYTALAFRARAAKSGSVSERPWSYIVLCVLLVTALLLTLSLGALLTLALTLLTVGIERLGVASGERRARRALVGVGAAAVGLFVFGMWFGMQPLAERLFRAGTGQEASALERLQFWGAALAIFTEHPVTGTGLSTFLHAFAGERPAGVKYAVNFAHNEWLQLLAETGLVGTLLAALTLWVLLSYTFQRRNPVRDNFYRRLSKGAGFGLLFVAVHSVVDFPLHIPANAAVATALAAACTLAGAQRRASQKSRPPEVPLPNNAVLRESLVLAGALALLALGCFDTRVLLAERAARSAAAQLEAGDPALALEEARRALDHAPRTPAYEHLLARALLAHAGKDTTGAQWTSFLTRAREALAASTIHAPRWPRYWTDRGAVAARLGLQQEAEAALLRAVELGPNDPYPLLERGLYHWRQRRYAIAVLDLREAQRLDERFVGSVMGVIERTTNGRAEDLKLLAPIIEQAIPDTAHAHRALADLYRRAGLRDHYRRELQRAFQRDPDNARLLAELFTSLNDVGQYETARQILNHYTQRNPRDAKALYLFGLAQAQTQRWADAIEAYQNSLALSPDQPEVYLALERAQKALGRDEGYRFWQALVKKIPHNPAYNYELAQRYAELNRWVEAVQELKLAVGKAPREVRYRNTLAGYYVNRRLYNEAIEQWKEVARLQPENTSPLLQIARTYVRLKLPDLARPFYKEILRLEPAHVEAREFLTKHAG